MKIKKKGNKFVAYRDENDNSERFDPRIKVGDQLGFINISTGKFVGNTVCIVELGKKQNDYVTSLVDEVIGEVKADIFAGDTTVLDEILKHVPIDVLIQSLPDERWEKFK